MKIRRVSEADRPDWIRMRRALWPEAREDHRADVERFFREPDPSLVTIVAESPAGGLCGFVEGATRNYAEGCHSSPVAYVEGWWVDAEFRKQGYGAALIAALEAWARNKGLTELASDAELANTGSQAAHEALGFGETARIVCFRKRLGAADDRADD